MDTLYLGSASSARKAILEKLGYAVLTRPSNADEDLDFQPANVEEMVVAITKLKTDAVYKSIIESQEPLASDWLVCGDILVIDAARNTYGKPKDVQEAKRFIAQYNKDMKLGTVQALEITNLQTGQRVVGTDVAWCVLNKPFPEEGLEEFLTNSGALYAAGGAIVESDYMSACIDHYDGEAESIMGLSPRLLNELMRKFQ